MPTDPKAIPPDVLHDGATRDAIIEALRVHAPMNTLKGDYWCEAADFIESRFPVSAEPSPNPLREALTWINIYAGDEGLIPAAPIRKTVREALAADQSQSDRTSDEAIPAEPTYEWRAVGEKEVVSLGRISARKVAHWFLSLPSTRRERTYLERRVPSISIEPGPWERVGDEGRRDG